MADPNTVNSALIIPATGADVGAWGSAALNPNFVAIDGLLGGVTTIGLSNVPVTLTAPSGSITPSAGPNQAQNAVLRLTGALTGAVTITLPLPGYYIVENLTTGNFVVTLRGVTATQVIGIDQGMCQHIYNDGANVRFVNLGETGKMELWAGISAIPAWVTACTVPPYLLCDGSVHNFSDYPYLGAKFLSKFGGNGISTFGVPDPQGRVPLAYDGTGSRITAAGCGINGQTIGASADNQSVTLSASQIPAISSAGVNNITVAPESGYPNVPTTPGTISDSAAGTGGNNVPFSTIGLWANAGVLGNPSQNISVTSNNTGGQLHTNVQPSQVTGIWVVRAA